MKRFCFIQTVLLAFFIFTGCAGKSSKEYITIDVSKSYPEKELILQDLFDIEYIQLETSDTFLTTGHILAVSDEFFVLKDVNRLRNGNIFLFDRNGLGISKFNHLGQGPEEYTNILDLVLDTEDDNMYINNHYSARVVVYDRFGNFKRSFKQKDGYFYNQMGNFNKDYLICHDGRLEYDKPNTPRNFFMLVSKIDGEIREIPIYYKAKKSRIAIKRDVKNKIVGDRSIYNKELIPFGDSWILSEMSSDTIFVYSQDFVKTPLIVRTPSVQEMDPEVFLYLGVITDQYYFMQSVKKLYDFERDNGFPTTNLVYDRYSGSVFEYTLYNSDFVDKSPMNLVYELPIPPVIINRDKIAFMTRLEAPGLVEAYEDGKLRGPLKEIAATLKEEDNPVIMIARYKK
ncbi:MAG: 6-bladed beta-propeller [Parabacteroides sp.]|nr:6-bladed beta-propeller [Parabacteroides sp.]